MAIELVGRKVWLLTLLLVGTVIVIFFGGGATQAVLNPGLVPGFEAGSTDDPIIARSSGNEVVVRISDLRELYNSFGYEEREQVRFHLMRKLRLAEMLVDSKVTEYLSQREIELSEENTNDIRIMAKIQELVERELTARKRRITSREVREYYEQNKQYFGVTKYIVTTVEFDTEEQADYFHSTVGAGFKFDKALNETRKKFASSGLGDAGGEGVEGGEGVDEGGEGIEGGEGEPPAEGGEGEPPTEGGQGGEPPPEGQPAGGEGQAPQGEEGNVPVEGEAIGSGPGEQEEDDTEDIGKIVLKKVTLELWKLHPLFANAMVDLEIGRCTKVVNIPNSKPAILFFHDKYREIRPLVEVEKDTLKSIENNQYRRIRQELLKNLSTRHSVEIDRELLAKLTFSDQVPGDISLGQNLVKIKGSDITVNDWYQEIKKYFKFEKPTTSDMALQKVFFLDEIISSRLLLIEAEKRGCTGTAHRANFTFAAKLEIFLNNHEESNPDIYSQYIVPDVEIEQYYEANKDQLYLDKVNLQVLLYADREVAERVWEKTASTHVFSESAKKMSMDKTKGKPFEIELISLDPMVSQIIKGMEPGEISTIVTTPAGYFIIKYNGIKRYQYNSIDGYLEQIIRRLEENKKKAFRRQWLDSLREKLNVEMDVEKVLATDME